MVEIAVLMRRAGQETSTLRQKKKKKKIVGRLPQAMPLKPVPKLMIPVAYDIAQVSSDPHLVPDSLLVTTKRTPNIPFCSFNVIS